MKHLFNRKAVAALTVFLAASPVAAQTYGLTPKTTDAANSLQVKSAPGSVYSVSATNETSTAGLLIGYDSTTVPSAGSLTASLIVDCVVLPANGTAVISHQPGPPTNFTVGITFLISSAATCATYTTGTITGFMSVKYQ